MAHRVNTYQGCRPPPGPPVEKICLHPCIHVHVIFPGVPLPPSPKFSVVNESTILVEWKESFAWQDFPIINYTMEVFNQTSDEPITSSVLDSNILSFTHTSPMTGSPGRCTNRTFSVVAHNSVGASVPGTVKGAFPSSELNCIVNHYLINSLFMKLLENFWSHLDMKLHFLRIILQY